MDREYVSRIEPGLRVIVTAGAAGIGRVIVEALHTCGAHIHVCDVDADAVADLNSALPEVGSPRRVPLRAQRAHLQHELGAVREGQTAAAERDSTLGKISGHRRPDCNTG